MAAPQSRLLGRERPRLVHRDARARLPSVHRAARVNDLGSASRLGGLGGGGALLGIAPRRFGRQIGRLCFTARRPRWST